MCLQDHQKIVEFNEEQKMLAKDLLSKDIPHDVIATKLKLPENVFLSCVEKLTNSKREPVSVAVKFAPHEYNSKKQYP